MLYVLMIPLPLPPHVRNTKERDLRKGLERTEAFI
jgi:hypothetical protein